MVTITVQNSDGHEYTFYAKSYEIIIEKDSKAERDFIKTRKLLKLEAALIEEESCSIE